MAPGERVAALEPVATLAPLTKGEVAAVVAWLDSIGEDDEAVRAVVLRQCETDPDARRWYFDPERAGGCIVPEREPQDCRVCAHWRRPGLSDGYCTARADLPSATALLHELPPDNGATCASFEDWRAALGPGACRNSGAS